MRVLILLAIVVSLKAASSEESAVRAVLSEQERAWNAGDLPAFVKTYSSETLFVGKEITRGNAGVLERYRRTYPTRERMGTLRYTDIEVRMLGPDYASVLGRFHLERTQEGGGSAQGVYTLLLKRTGKQWHVILDHTS